MSFNIEELMSKDKKVIRDVTKRIGRPKKNIIRNNMITTYLSDDENKKLRALAEKSNLTLASYVRNILTKQLE